MSNARTPKTIDVTQQEKLLEALLRKDSPPKTLLKGLRNYLIACLMLDAGLRVGEVVGLQKSHLYFNGHPVSSLLLTPSITKNHKERTVPVNDRLNNAIVNYLCSNQWLVHRYETYSIWGNEIRDTPLTTRQVENILNAASLKAFGRRINPHILRHTFASNLLRVTNMRTVQELLGHSYITSTQIYTHPNEDDKKKAIEDLEQQTKSLGQELEDLAGLGS